MRHSILFRYDQARDLKHWWFEVGYWRSVWSAVLYRLYLWGWLQCDETGYFGYRPHLHWCTPWTQQLRAWDNGALIWLPRWEWHRRYVRDRYGMVTERAK